MGGQTLGDSGVDTRTRMNIVVDGIIYEQQTHGGVSRLYNEVLGRMCDLDDSLRITLLTEGSLKQALPEHAGITHRVVPSTSRYLRPGRVWGPAHPSIRRLVMRLWAGSGEGQIWHSTYYTLPGHWVGLQVVTVADMIYERYVDLFNTPYDEQFRERKRRCITAADAVICISETTRRDLQCFSGIGPDLTYTVPLACSHVFRQLGLGDDVLNPPIEQPFILYVGDRTHHKNFDSLVQAYGAWRSQPAVGLVVVGQPWSDDEKRCLAVSRIQDCVHLLTDVDDEALCHLYNRAAAFVYPSLYEGFGIPLLEAMSCACPIVASRIPSTVEVAGECPVYFDSTEVESLLAAFDIVLSEGRNSERVQVGLEQVRGYSWDKTARQTLEVYLALRDSQLSC